MPFGELTGSHYVPVRLTNPLILALLGCTETCRNVLYGSEKPEVGSSTLPLTTTWDPCLAGVHLVPVLGNVPETGRTGASTGARSLSTAKSRANRTNVLPQSRAQVSMPWAIPTAGDRPLAARPYVALLLYLWVVWGRLRGCTLCAPWIRAVQRLDNRGRNTGCRTTERDDASGPDTNRKLSTFLRRSVHGFIGLGVPPRVC